MSQPIKAVGLLSGGLDSTLAAAIMQQQGIDVLGINFNTGLCLTDHRRQIRRRRDKGAVPRSEALRAGADLTVPVELVDISNEYLEVVTKPRYGYGKAANPCIDCRIMMIEKAAEYMRAIGARFIFTGEVLGQRPMTQHRGSLDLIAKKSGTDGFLLRPLSAKCLQATIPEEKGWVDRDRLYGISGRSRKEQMRLAEELNLPEYPQPAGGCCFLTDRNYARKFHDLLEARGEDGLTMDDLLLLKVGRHFRLDSTAKLIVGREEGENVFLERYVDGRLRLEVDDVRGPVALIEGRPDDDAVKLAAGITARYSDAPAESKVNVSFTGSDGCGTLKVTPAPDSLVEQYRI